MPGVDLGRFVSEVGLDIVPPHLRLLGMETPRFDEEVVAAAAEYGLSPAHLAALTSAEVLGDELDEDDALDDLRLELAAEALNRLPVFERPTFSVERFSPREIRRWYAGSTWTYEGFPAVYDSLEAAAAHPLGRADHVLTTLRHAPGPAIRDGRRLGIGLRAGREARFLITEVEQTRSGYTVTLGQQGSRAEHGWAALSDATRAHIRRHDNGRPFLVAFYNERDWRVREKPYEFLPSSRGAGSGRQRWWTGGSASTARTPRCRGRTRTRRSSSEGTVVEAGQQARPCQDLGVEAGGCASQGDRLPGLWRRPRIPGRRRRDAHDHPRVPAAARPGPPR